MELSRRFATNTMKTLLTLLLALCAIASASGQTIRTLGYTTTNGKVVYSGTNVLNFTNQIRFGETNDGWLLTSSGLQHSGGFILDTEGNSIVGGGLTIGFGSAIGFGGTNEVLFASTTRTNLGLPLPALTNTSNVTTMRALGGSTNTNEPFNGSFEVSVPGGNILMIFSNGIFLRQEQGS